MENIQVSVHMIHQFANVEPKEFIRHLSSKKIKPNNFFPEPSHIHHKTIFMNSDLSRTFTKALFVGLASFCSIIL